MDKFMRLFYQIFAIFLILFLFSISATDLFAKKSPDSTPLKKVKLQLKWKHQFQFAGYYAAIEKGFYKA